jgi:pimeloyl-ACP methyl ester carboxylesterase
MDKRTTFGGTDIYYRNIGHGQPIILVHGFGEDGTIWENQILFLESRFNLIIPDLPGSGKSVPVSHIRGILKIDSTSPVPANSVSVYPSMDYYADLIKTILDVEEINICVMIGHSMGGYITLAFAEKYPGLLDGFGLFHSTAYADSDEKKAIRTKAIEFIWRQGGQAFLKQSIPNLFAEKFRLEQPGKIGALIAAGANFSAETLVQYYEAMLNRPDRTGVLTIFRKPILFIIGEDDKSVILQESLSQCQIPDLSLISILPGVAHMGMWEDIDQSNNAILKYLNLVNDT